MKDLIAFVEQVIKPIQASAARKETMREELLSHLSAAYDEEFQRCHDPQAAFDAARRRFGNASDLSHQLQSLVPLLEHLWAQFLRKEIPMSRWFWVISWIALIIVMMFIAPDNDLRQMLAMIAIIGAIGVVRLSQQPNNVTRWFGPRWGWSAFAVLFGPGIILPALAQYYHQQRPISVVAVPIILGVLIILIGIGSFVHALVTRYAQVS